MSRLSQQRMQKIIFTSFKKLLESTKFSNLTMTAIASDALIHRNTIYQYFDDKFDLLTKYIDFELIDSSVCLIEFESHPFKTIHDISHLSFEKVIIYQHDDHGFQKVMQNFFIQKIVSSQNDSTIFWAFGKVGSILLWNELHNDYYNMFTDYEILDNIYVSKKFPEIP
ncbi:hypothetical protein LES9216_02077 [Leuconostoc suionicum]|uniref:HTH tetR-type domain-containing protein n=1 Tax=Leuconostoc suionicum TaxID=1511761 RepID=A0A2N9KHE2_9LACO|nr:TetR/AcrR family transcriptional regulator [Leuconostoc suionicum]SPD95081.1 hypothetical protein LES8486_02047 [Leuconostoc suionicum]SPE09879.1 hypothetical protein LES9216_02077 [Leuconostoc suionicum]SPH05684.1 hypothetical protein LES8484_02047 [Leuconostoc suionicum]